MSAVVSDRQKMKALYEEHDHIPAVMEDHRINGINKEPPRPTAFPFTSTYLAIINDIKKPATTFH
ncbi:Uncharacterised protein [Salmonella enterica]|nr:Uncharacterised protein [Salmonella enterica]